MAKALNLKSHNGFTVAKEPLPRQTKGNACKGLMLVRRDEGFLCSGEPKRMLRSDVGSLRRRVASQR